MQTKQVHQRHEYNSCTRSMVASPGACRSLRFAQGQSVIYASIDAKSGRKRSLVRPLLQELKRIDPRCCISTNGPLTLHKTVLGAPFLSNGKKMGPPLSFSRGAGRLWAAMCFKGKIGVDVAFPEEFSESYPFARAFGDNELPLAKSSPNKMTCLRPPCCGPSRKPPSRLSEQVSITLIPWMYL